MRYHRGDLGSTIRAARDLASKRNAPVFVAATAYGWSINRSDMTALQGQYKVLPGGDVLDLNEYRVPVRIRHIAGEWIAL